MVTKGMPHIPPTFAGSRLSLAYDGATEVTEKFRNTTSIALRSQCYMDKGNSSEPRDKGRTSKARARKPYTKPEFRFELAFETQALSCGKTNPTQKQCNFNRKVS